MFDLWLVCVGRGPGVGLVLSLWAVDWFGTVEESGALSRLAGVLETVLAEVVCLEHVPAKTLISQADSFFCQLLFGTRLPVWSVCVLRTGFVRPWFWQ